MEVFRELHIRASSSEQLVVLMDEVERALPAGWTRVPFLEEDLRNRESKYKRFFCFDYEGDEGLPTATIFLAEEVPGLLILSNIVPRKKYQLAIGESNALLEEFSERILRPCAERLGVQVGLTAGHRDLTHWLSKATTTKFRRFSDGANRRAGYLLPIDRDRWLEFILAAHREKSQLDPSTLRRWLIEIEGWSPDIANQLAGEYAFGEEILTYSESHLAGA
jgi:hypothetical protein